MSRTLILCCLLLGLNACTKPPDLDAPCKAFGKYCAQAPINVSPISST